MTIKETKLANGMRIVTDNVDSVETIALGVWAAVGARHEGFDNCGVAHLVEHMMFKGTPSRSAIDISHEIENVGGHMNAYTSREITAYHMHMMAEDAPLAIDVLADIMQHPTFDEKELERERGVILQEIGMYNDTPDEIIFDKFQETAWQNQNVGTPILGRADNIKNMPQDALFQWVKEHYKASNLVFAAAGKLDHHEIVAQVEKLFCDLEEGKEPQSTPAHYTHGEYREEKELEQAHVILGFNSFSRHDEDYYAAGLLSTILGGGFSSRLYNEIREKRGLVYSIFAFNQSYDDNGQFEIYAGTDPQRLDELMSVLCDELNKAKDGFTEDEVDRAKAQIRSSMLMGQEKMMGRARRLANCLIHYDRPVPIEETMKKIDAIDAAQIQRAAIRIFSTAPTLATLGTLDKLENYDQIAARLTTKKAA